MSRFFKSIFAAAVILLSFVSCNKVPEAVIPVAEDTGGKGLLWEVSDGDTTVYILGSMPIGSDLIYPVSEKLDGLIKSSNVAVFEIDFGDLNGLKYMEAGKSFTDGSTLGDYISDELLSRVRQIAVENPQWGISGAVIDLMRPWALADIIIKTAYEKCERLKAQSETVDAYVYRIAKDAKLKIRQLEGYRLRTDTMNNFSEYALEKYLQESVELYENGGSLQALEDALIAWHERDTEAYEKIFYEGKLGNSISKSLIQKGCDTSSQYVLKLLSQEKGQFFLTVNSEYIVGDSGVLKQLTSAGYDIKVVPLD